MNGLGGIAGISHTGESVPGGPDFRRVVTRSVLLLLSLAVVASVHEPPPDPPRQTSRACVPMPSSLGISPDSARLEPFIYPFIEKVGRVPGYSDHWIEHQPRYHVVATFTRPPRLSEVQRLAPREIRDRIEIRAAKRTREEIAVMRDDIARRLQTGRLTGWSSGYTPKTQCFEITVASVGAVTQVRTANERAADRCGRARRTSPAAALGS